MLLSAGLLSAPNRILRRSLLYRLYGLRSKRLPINRILSTRWRQVVSASDNPILSQLLDREPLSANLTTARALERRTARLPVPRRCSKDILQRGTNPGPKPGP